MVVPTQRGLFQDFLIDGDTHVTLPVIVFFSRFAGKSKPPHPFHGWSFTPCADFKSWQPDNSVRRQGRHKEKAGEPFEVVTLFPVVKLFPPLAWRLGRMALRPSNTIVTDRAMVNGTCHLKITG